MYVIAYIIRAVNDSARTASKVREGIR